VGTIEIKSKEQGTILVLKGMMIKVNYQKLFILWTVLIFLLGFCRHSKLFGDDKDLSIIRNLLSPSWFSYFVISLGPLPTLLLLTLSYINTGITSINTLHWSSLLQSIIFYFSLINLLRYGKDIAPNNWDPSGHIFIYSLQLIPLSTWCHGEILCSSSSSSSSSLSLSSSSSSSTTTTTTSSFPTSFVVLSIDANTSNFYSIILRTSLLFWSAILIWMTSMTTLFFHIWSEIFASWIISVALLFSIEYTSASIDNFALTLSRNDFNVCIASIHVAMLYTKPIGLIYLLGSLLAFGLTIKKGEEDSYSLYVTYLLYDIFFASILLLGILKVRNIIEIEINTIKKSSESTVGNVCDSTAEIIAESSSGSRRRSSPST
jgi:hypothetical protein